MTHEVGQYVVYPNLAELPKYDSTPLRATAWEAIKADLEKKGRLDEAARYTRDSGKLAALLYKEDLERALRTKGLAGIQLLQLQDFPGQSTATVGLLDAFWDSKGIITPAEFRRFCAPTVPLARMKKFTWLNSETFQADIEAAHFAERPLTNATATWSLRDGTSVIGEGSFAIASLPLGNGIPLGSIQVSLAKVQQAVQLTLEVSITAAQAANSWSVWVYPALPAAAENPAGFTVARGVDGHTLATLAAGQTVVLLPPAGAVKKPIPGRFIPVFWSPLHFPNQPGTLGATIETAHPLWRQFPTSTHTDWQWWELTAKSVAVDLDGLDPDITKPFRFVDKYNRNALPSAIFEARVGPGKLLVCTLDVDSDLDSRIVARQLRRALFAYAGSAEFEPKGKLSPDQLAALFGKREWIVTATSENAAYPAELAADGDPNTFWHSDWGSGHKASHLDHLGLVGAEGDRGLQLPAAPGHGQRSHRSVLHPGFSHRNELARLGPPRRISKLDCPSDRDFPQTRQGKVFAPDRVERSCRQRVRRRGGIQALAERRGGRSRPGHSPGF